MALGGKDEVTLQRVAYRLNVAASDGPDERCGVRRVGSVHRWGNLQPFEHRRIRVCEQLGVQSEVRRGIRYSSAEGGFASVVDFKEEDVVVVHGDTDGDAIQLSRQLWAASGCPLVVSLGEYDDGVAVNKQECGTR